ncbi:hypothetical protein D3C75_1098010 [compost metagenome]
MAYVNHPVLRHISGPGIADMGVMLPNHNPGSLSIKFCKLLQGRHHMTVPDIPRLSIMTDHDPVIRLGIPYGQGIHLPV